MKLQKLFAELKRRNVPLLVNLREDPRWQSFLRVMGMAEEQLK
jgi:hypothetical protein